MSLRQKTNDWKSLGAQNVNAIRIVITFFYGDSLGAIFLNNVSHYYKYLYLLSCKLYYDRIFSNFHLEPKIKKIELEKLVLATAAG